MNKIKKLTLEIISQYGTNNPIAISKTLNILIIYDDLGDTIEGFLQQVDKQFIIHVNKRNPLYLPIIAHELGHYFLHQSINHFKVSKSSLFFPLDIELEANQFASELLLTDDMFHCISESSPYSIQEIASHFDLPIYLVELKLATLTKGELHL